MLLRSRAQESFFTYVNTINLSPVVVLSFLCKLFEAAAETRLKRLINGLLTVNSRLYLQQRSEKCFF